MSKEEISKRIDELHEEYKTLSLGDWRRHQVADQIAGLMTMRSLL
jgi:hypothetical protein